eukprot:TRINITY_DN2639_c0_g1_i1.p1 TRINITY_DN2639_c0_g1~~TRINITY_DN2639_c0_g1_i1.p1  ORF type:complete len:133 (-),score=11.70 TRINITY_DN2639_c0_g1_i1:155-553(-)
MDILRSPARSFGMKFSHLVRSFVLFMSITICKGGNGEIYYDEIERQKKYEEEERGKVAPMRTFLNTWEIALICIFSIIALFLLICLIVYLCRYGCVAPSCCRKREKDVSEIELQRERKIGEIWESQYQPVRT